MGDALGLTATYISLLETGKRQPRWRTVERIAEVCGYRIVFAKKDCGTWPLSLLGGGEDSSRDTSIKEAMRKALDEAIKYNEP
jgi:transcriptional regulator with XRE-family HTH domain